jgi:formiminoglutamase
MQAKVRIYARSTIDSFLSIRGGEHKLGEKLQFLGTQECENLRTGLDDAYRSGVRYALLGIPEDIGPRANGGRPGSGRAWASFLTAFLNVQDNRFFDSNSLLLLGEVETSDLMKAGAAEEAPSRLRELCAQLDERVAPVVKQIRCAGIEPIVIGGGHNNCYPIIKGINAALRERGVLKEDGIACLNCDPHADFRLLEGRHSGNGFSTAHDEGLLRRYFVLALQESYNSEAMLTRFTAAGFRFKTFEEIFIRQESTLAQATDEAIAYLRGDSLPVGIELDLDCIENFPASAHAPFGLQQREAAQLIHRLALSLETEYLHLPEGAPQLADNGERKVGRTIALLVMSYLRARQARRQSVGK